MTDIVGPNRRDLLVGAGAVMAGIGVAVGNSRPASAQNAQTVDYSLQRDVSNLHVPSAITVIGTGGFGAWTALFSALCGVDEMLLIDAANLDARDLARTPFKPGHLGRPKAEALRDLILEFRPAAKLTAQKRFVEPGDEDVYFGEVLFDGTDYEPLFRALPEAARQRNMRFVHGFYDGNVAGVSDTFIEEMQYRKEGETPVWVGSAALSGVPAIYSAYAAPLNFIGTPEKLNMSPQAMAAEAQRVGEVDK